VAAGAAAAWRFAAILRCLLLLRAAGTALNAPRSLDAIAPEEISLPILSPLRQADARAT